MSLNNTKQHSIALALIKFCTPLILSGILQQLYNWVDAFIVGNINGEGALAAVGAVWSINNFYIMAITGFTTGLSILIAQKYGAGEIEEIRKILSTFLCILGVIVVALSVFAFVMAQPVLKIMDTPADIFDYSVVYLKIVCIGIPFLTVYNLYSVTLRAMGDSRTPFLAVLVSSVVNIILDIVFVAVFRWGVAGAAYATIISQIAMTVFVVIYAVKKHTAIRFHFGRGMVHRDCIAQSVSFGIPPMVQSCITAFGNMILQGFMNSFGTATVAAITTAYRVDSIALLPVINLGSGISTLVAQNHGAGDDKKAWRVFTTGTLIMLGTAVVLTLLVVTFGGFMVAIFGVGEQATAIGAQFFRCLGSFYTVFGISMACRGFVEGMGGVVYSSIFGVVALGVRIALSYLLRGVYGNMVIAFAEGFSWVLMMLLFAVRCYIIRKRQTETL